MDSLVCNDEVVVGKHGKISNLDLTDSIPDYSTETAPETDCTVEVLSNDYFVERESVLKILNRIFAPGGEHQADCATLRVELRYVVQVIERYREDPSLLDPHVVDLLRPIIDNVLLVEVKRSGDPQWRTLNSMGCSLVYVVSSVVGCKTLTQIDVFPHDVYLLEPVLRYCEYLESFPELWESRFVLFLWLAVLVMCPFSFDTIGIGGLSERLLLCARSAIKANKALVKASSIFASRLFSRADDVQLLLFSKYVSAGAAFSFEAIHKTLRVVFPSRSILQDIYTLGNACSDKKLLIGILGSIGSLSSPIDSVELIEECIEKILSFSSDKEGAVRLSVAKSVGRLCVSLPALYADQLIDYLFSNLMGENDFEFHTKCLICGEFARSGIASLRPAPLIETAISALEKERTLVTTLGQQIRDAGCAIIWSLARRDKSDYMLSVIEMVLPALLNTALFERDINLRRAAAAALQELIGRIGTVKFPLGLLIIDLIDFWSVSSIKHSYLEIPSLLLSRILENTWEVILRESFIKHLRDEKLLKFQNPEMISLSASALARLTGDHSEELISFFCERVLCEEEWRVRYGGIQLVSSYLDSVVGILSAELQSKIRNLVPSIEKKRLFRGKGGDLIREASYGLIGSIFSNRSKFSFADETRRMKFVEKMIEILAEGSVHLLEKVQLAAIIALKRVSNQREEGCRLLQSLVEKYLSDLLDTGKSCMNLCARRGKILVISCLGAFSEPVLDLLKKEAVSWPIHFVSNEFLDPICRKYALFGLIRFLATEPEKQDIVADCVLECMEDFQSDKRGDVGSWVRDIAIEAAVLILSRRCDLVEDEKFLAQFFSHLGEKLDKIRLKVLETVRTMFSAQESSISLDSIFYKTIGMPPEEVKTDLFAIDIKISHSNRENFPLSDCPFHLLCQFIHKFPSFHDSLVLNHLVNCVGSLTNSATSRAAEKAMRSLLLPDCSNQIYNAVIENLRLHLSPEKRGIKFQSKSDFVHRIFIPGINTLALLAGENLIPVDKIKIIDGIVRRNIDTVPCPPILSVNRLKTVSHLYSRIFLDSPNICEFIVSHILLSNIPVVRFKFVSDLLLFLASSSADSASDLIDLFDSCDWMTENESEWMPSVIAFANKFHVDIPTSATHAERIILRTKQPAYADFVNEVHRFR